MNALHDMNIPVSINRAISVAVEDLRSVAEHNGPKDIIYQDVINFPRSTVKGQHTCVMCGKMDGQNCVIPGQNKDVCKVCDSIVWSAPSREQLFKFCKGCKNFVTIADFCEKPKASKCGKCRNRCRSSYSAKRTSGNLSSDSYEQEFAKQRISDSPRGVSDMGFEEHLPASSLYDMLNQAGNQCAPPLANCISPSLYGNKHGIASPYMSSVGKENHMIISSALKNKKSVNKPAIGNVLGEQQSNTLEQDSVKSPEGKNDGAETPSSSSLLLPRIPNSLLNIHSASNRPRSEEQAFALTPTPDSTGKCVLEELLLLNSSLRKSPLTFVSGMPSPDSVCGYTGFSEGRSPLATNEHVPMTPLLNNGTPMSERSMTSQEQRAWYHDVLVAMSKDDSVKKQADVRRAKSLDEAELPVAKRIRYGDAPSPSPSLDKEHFDVTPPSSQCLQSDRNAMSCPPGMKQVDSFGRVKIERSASYSHPQDGRKVGKWEWDPTANPLMHLAMVLSKNETEEEKIFKDLSSESSDDSDSEYTQSVNGRATPPSASMNKDASCGEYH